MTAAESAVQRITSPLDSVRIDAAPNSVPHTSPDTLDDTGNIFSSRYPSASAPTEIIATAASPLIRVFCPVLSSKTARITVNGKTMTSSFDTFRTDATASAPNAAWDSPSPINENRFSTSVTPNSAEQSAISTPTAIA